MTPAAAACIGRPAAWAQLDSLLQVLLLLRMLRLLLLLKLLLQVLGCWGKHREVWR